jgi:hypothetical protein
VSSGTWLLASVAGLAWACSTQHSREDLPEVLSPLPWNTCPAVRAGRPITEGTTFFLGGGLLACADTEFQACRAGRVRYRLRLGKRGELLALDFEEPRIPPVAACVEKRLRSAVFVPAVDCTHSPVESVFDGVLSWDPSRGISESVPGESGIVPALPECYVRSLAARQAVPGPVASFAVRDTIR